MNMHDWSRAELVVWAFLCRRVSALLIESNPAAARALHDEETIARREIDRRDREFDRVWRTWIDGGGGVVSASRRGPMLHEDRFPLLMDALESVIRKGVSQ